MKTTKENILKECFKLFLSKGYDATSIPDIERVTKISRGAIFYHFLNKEDIFKQCADYFVLSFLKDVDYGDEYLCSTIPLKTFIDKCIEIIETRMDQFFKNTDFKVTTASCLSFTLYLKDHYEGWPEKVLEYKKQKIEAWVNAINLAKKRKEIYPDTDSILLAEIFLNLYMGLSYEGALVDKLSILDLQRL